ncbi:MAG: hypothetical protein QM704_14780 [Anaeromyxobacteraceae bacterium]
MREGRRAFIQVIILGSAGLAAGCGGGAEPDPTGGNDGGGQQAQPNCSTHGGTAASISANHGHVLAIPAADFADGLDHAYSIMGTADHDHTLALTSAQLASIKAGTQVALACAMGGIGVAAHDHTVTTACASSGGTGGGGGYNPYP